MDCLYDAIPNIDAKILNNSDLGFVGDFDECVESLNIIKTKVSYWRYCVNPTYYCIDQIIKFMDSMMRTASDMVKQSDVEEKVSKKFSVSFAADQASSNLQAMVQFRLAQYMLSGSYQLEMKNNVAVVYVSSHILEQKLKNMCKDSTVLHVVENSGVVSNHKGVNLPNVDVDLPAISEKDKKELKLV